MLAPVRSLADRALTVAALAGLLAVLATVVGIVLGVRPLLFRSGSMAPTITTGSVALAREVPARDLRVGDVVSVRTAAGERVTHRVTGMQPAGASAALTLRGDANAAADAESYVVRSAYRVFWHVPKVGYAVAALHSLPGRFGLGLVVAGMLLGATGRRARARPGRHQGRHRGRGRAAVAVATVTVLAGPAGPASAAPWTDDVVVSGGTFTAGAVPASGSFTCGTLGIGSATFTWSAVAGATSYTLHYGSGGASTMTVAGTSQTVAAVVTGGTAWVQANVSYGGVTWTSVASQSRTYSVFALVISTCS